MSAAPNRPMTAAELQAHPEYPHVVWQLKPDRKERLPVAKGRGGPFSIAFEVHGKGPRKLVWIMGLGSLKLQWQRQTKDFGHKQADKYSCLIIDNRGMGDSDKPKLRYSTSEMAKDVLEVIDHVGWTEQRQLNIVGVSMGGMISQELAAKIPSRINSLCLVSTAPHIYNTVGYLENLRSRVNLFIPKSFDEQIANTKRNCYTQKWLTAPDESECAVEKFPTNGDRSAAMEVTKRTNPEIFDRAGFILQLIAAGWHKKTPKQLSAIADEVGRERILVAHGTEDRMITFPHGELLLKGLGGEESGVTKRFVEGQSHVLPAEMRREFNGWVEEMVEKGERLNKA